MAFSITSLGTVASTSGGSTTAVLTTGVDCPKGSLLVICIEDSSTTLATAVPVLSAGGTPVAINPTPWIANNNAAANGSAAWFYVYTTADLPSGGTITYTKKTPGADCSVGAFFLPAWQVSGPPVNASYAYGSGTNPTNSATGNAGSLALGFAAATQKATVWGADPGLWVHTFTDLTGTTNVGPIAAYAQSAPGGSLSFSPTLTVTDTWVAFQCFFAPIITGAQATFSAGGLAVVPSDVVAPIGAQLNSEAGSFVGADVPNLGGAHATFSAGTVSSITAPPVAGVQITSSASALAQKVALVGVQFTSTAAASAISEALSIAGVSINSAAGSFAPAPVVAAVGAEINSAVGSFGEALVETASGVQLSSSAGNFTPTAPASATGAQINSTAAAIAQTESAALSGAQINSEASALSLTPTPAGVAIHSSAGTFGVSAGTEQSVLIASTAGSFTSAQMLMAAGAQLTSSAGYLGPTVQPTLSAAVVASFAGTFGPPSIARPISGAQAAWSPGVFVPLIVVTPAVGAQLAFTAGSFAGGVLPSAVDGAQMNSSAFTFGFGQVMLAGNQVTSEPGLFQSAQFLGAELNSGAGIFVPVNTVSGVQIDSTAAAYGIPVQLGVQFNSYAQGVTMSEVPLGRYIRSVEGPRIVTAQDTGRIVTTI